MMVTIADLVALLVANGCMNIVYDDAHAWTSVTGTFNQQAFECVINGTELQLYCLNRPTKEHIARILNV